MKKPNIDPLSMEAQSEGNILQSNEGIQEFTTLCQRQLAIEDAISALEESLSEKKAELLKLSQYTIPELAETLGIHGLPLATGEKVEIKNDLKAAISKEKFAKACQWLRQHNLGSIIKQELRLAFGTGSDEQVVADLAKIALEDAGLQDRYTQSETVHSSTLKATLKTEIEAGRLNDAGRKLLGVYEYKVTKIKRG